MKRVIIIVMICASLGCNSDQTPQESTDVIEFIAFEQVADLDPAVKETSGLTKYNESLWTINDSGNPNEIYQLDLAGNVLSTVLVDGAVNTDWEDLTSDESQLYIGNFGNNLGQRKDLVIYGIDLDSLGSDEVSVSKNIRFSYSDQTSFPGNYSHNFDCEAMISYDDNIYLFSKSWQDNTSMLYRLPKVSGDHALTAIDTFDTGGVITGAALSPKGDQLCLLGYNFTLGVFNPFIWILSDFEGSDFFSGSSKRYNLDSKRQMEAVEWITDRSLIITAEQEGQGSPTMYKIAL